MVLGLLVLHSVCVCVCVCVEAVLGLYGGAWASCVAQRVCVCVWLLVLRSMGSRVRAQ